MAARIACDSHPERFLAVLERGRFRATRLQAIVEAMRGVFLYDWPLEKVARAFPDGESPIERVRDALREIARLHA